MKFAKGNYVHVCARGARGLPIVYDNTDRWHFLDMLYYLNHKGSRRNLFRELREERALAHSSERFFWPPAWSPRHPLVAVVCYALVENHYHLLLREDTEGGIPLFMQKMGIGFAKYYNARYDMKGTLFQGTYQGKLIDTDEYLSYVSVYIQVKNILEVYPGGLRKALREFDKAFDWAANYSFGSLGDYAGYRQSPIIQKAVLGEMFSSASSYRAFARECVLGMNLGQKLGKLAVEGQ